jgi:hypothetical protein
MANFKNPLHGYKVATGEYRDTTPIYQQVKSLLTKLAPQDM